MGKYHLFFLEGKGGEEAGVLGDDVRHVLLSGSHLGAAAN